MTGGCALLLSDLAGGGGGGDGRVLSSRFLATGDRCARTGSGGVGGTIAVEPLLTFNVREGGFASRDKLR